MKVFQIMLFWGKWRKKLYKKTENLQIEYFSVVE